MLHRIALALYSNHAQPSAVKQLNSSNMKNLIDLARSFVNTDTAAVRDDVQRLGSVKAAADYSADMSAGQPDWEALDSDEGREALVAAIADLEPEHPLTGKRVEAGSGEGHDTGLVSSVLDNIATVNWDSLVTTKIEVTELRPL